MGIGEKTDVILQYRSLDGEEGLASGRESVAGSSETIGL